MPILKTAWQILTSMKTMVILVLIFALSCAVATFIENDHGIETSWALVYGSTWFEILQILLGVNLVANIIKFKLYKRKKLPAFIFHIGFLVILIGSGLTRYMGHEGVLHIREGEAENRMLSADALVQLKATSGGETIHADKKLFVSAIGGNSFEMESEVGGKDIEITLKRYIKNAHKTVVSSESGEPIISLVVTTPYGPEEHVLTDGEYSDLGPFALIFGDKEPTNVGKPYFFFYVRDAQIFFRSNVKTGWMKMREQTRGVFNERTEYAFEPKMMYMIQGTQIVAKEALLKGVEKVVSADEVKSSVEIKTNLSALVVDVEVDGEHREVALMGKGKRYKGFEESFTLNGVEISLEWGSKQLLLPFKLYLDEFVMDKYPGSMSPSSYESHVTVKDPANSQEFPYRIYMNNTLEYGGYKFFQSSYDQDEKGTILSVNHDPGKWPTYLGYTLLALGLFLNFFNPNGRFGKLARKRYTRGIASSVLAIVALVAVVGTDTLHAQDGHEGHNHAPGEHVYAPEPPSISEVYETVKKIDQKHADHYATMLVQDNSGRIKPLDSYSIEILNKVHGSDTILDLNHNQVILGMSVMPSFWQRIDMIKVRHPEVNKILGISPDQKYFAFEDIFDAQGNYKLGKAAEEALRKRPAERGKFEKEILKVDERVSIAYMVYTGGFMRVLPIKDHEGDKWVDPSSALKEFEPAQAEEISAILQQNMSGLREGMVSGDWSRADEAVERIKAFQAKYGGDVSPAQLRIDAELLYNSLDLFNKLVPVYLLSGFLMLFLIFARLVKPSIDIMTPTKIVAAILFVAFLAHTFNLGLRWYIAGHAPWSNGYEAMLYISWSIMLAGLLFAKQSEFAISTTAIFSGVTLFVAHLSWLDPQITTLVPVLKSYWLTIHVSIITASYGFLGLSAMLGFIALLLFIMLRFGNSATKEQIVLNIKETARINEMSMIVGLALLAVGNFLGGVWANESWGRYWGWDPKETWALITILVYTAILHLRFIPSVWNQFNFAAVSLVAYSSVIMTYFGVNYYLSGMHSYASGDPVPIPGWVMPAIGIIILFIVAAFLNRKEFARIDKLMPKT